MNDLSTARKLLLSAIITIVFYAVLESAARLVEFIDPNVSSLELLSSGNPDDVFRVFVYGGSTVAGFPVEQFGFVSQLEFWLRALHPTKPLEIYNLGAEGKPSAFVRLVVERTVYDDPDLLIVLSGHNEFLPSAVENEQQIILHHLALFRVGIRLHNKVQAKYFPHGPRIEFSPSQLEPYLRGSDAFQKEVDRYTGNLRQITRIALKHEVPLFLVTPPANLADWPPVYKELTLSSHYDSEYESRIVEAADLVNNGPVDNAIQRIEELLSIYPDDAMLHYLLGRSNLALGNHEPAKMLFGKARDLDPIPLRVLPAFIETLKEMSEADGVFLIDAARRFHQESPYGLVGFSLVADNCHPTPLGNALIARTIIAAMNKNALFAEQDLELWSLDDQLETFLTESLNREDRLELEEEFLLEMALYTMKTPFLNFSASQMYLRQALILDASDWRIWANLATLSLLEDHSEEGRRELGEAIRLRGRLLDPEDRGNLPYLKEALQRSAIVMEDLQPKPDVQSIAEHIS